MEIRRISSSECIRPIPGVIYIPSNDDHPFGESEGLPDRFKEEGFIPPQEKPRHEDPAHMPPFLCW